MKTIYNNRHGGEKNMKFRTLIISLLAAILLSACGSDSTNEEKSSDVKKTQDIKELVSEYSTGKPKGEVASITSEQLIVSDSKGNQSLYDLPEDEFFVSIAPYVNQTHP